MKEFFRKSFDLFYSFSILKKVTIILLSFFSILAVISVFFIFNKTNYLTLVSNITKEDSSSIIRYLRKNKIPFKVNEDGSTIMIPRNYIYDLRLELASKGLAQTSVVGYEIFDNQKFGTTSAVQKINRKRATEGELVRTINYIIGVERSRVHLAIPRKSPFIEENEKPTASVVLDLAAGFELTEVQVRSIQSLVASSVQGLDSDGVSIISTTGKQLSKNIKNLDALFAAATLDYQRKYESKLEKKIIKILGRVVGEGKVIAQVSADLDFSKVSETKTLFDGDSAAPRSISKNRDEMRGTRPLASGSPGVRTQVPGADGTLEQDFPESSVVRNQTTRNRDITNYEIPQTTFVKEKPLATLKRLSVAVMLDGHSEGDGEEGAREWSEESIEEFRSLVANAVGWVKERDPNIEIKVMKFFKENTQTATAAWRESNKMHLYSSIIGWSGAAIFFTLLFVFVVRPLIRWLIENTSENVEDFLPQTLEELEEKQANKLPEMNELLPEMEEKIDPVKVQGEMIKERVSSLIKDSPYKAAQLVHEWINQKNGHSSMRNM